MKNWIIFFLVFFSSRANAQIITTVAGGGTSTASGIPATTAIITDPNGGVFDKQGNFYFAQDAGNKISKIDTAGIITTVVGTGNPGFRGDGGLADTSELNGPCGVVVDTFGNLYICDRQNNRIRKVDIATGIISTIAGNGTPGFSGDSGLATNAMIYYPAGICLDKHGNLYIGDGSHRIRKVNTSGVITTIAGIGVGGVSGDGGPAIAAKCGSGALCTDAIGNLYITDNETEESRIAKIDTFGIITTYAGTDTGYVYNGDGIAATVANINPVYGVFDKFGDLFFADLYNNRIREIDTDGIIHNIAGNGMHGYSGDGGPALLAELYYPAGIAFDACGNLFIAEVQNARIRKITFDSTCGKADTTAAVQHVQVGGFSVYPNPATSEIRIETSPVLFEGEVTVYDMVGREIVHTMLNTNTTVINCSAWAKGVYMIVITDPSTGQKVTKKVLKE